MTSNVWKNLQSEVSQSTLKSRARSLSMSETSQIETQKDFLVVFLLGDEKYAIDSQRIDKVIPGHSIVKIPGANSLAAGLSYYEGTNWLVLDTKVLFTISESNKMSNPYLILLNENNKNIMLLVDDILEQKKFNRSEEIIHFSNSNLICPEVISGVYQEDISIIDIDKLFEFITHFSFISGE